MEGRSATFFRGPASGSFAGEKIVFALIQFGLALDEGLAFFAEEVFAAFEELLPFAESGFGLLQGFLAALDFGGSSRFVTCSIDRGLVTEAKYESHHPPQPNVRHFAQDVGNPA